MAFAAALVLLTIVSAWAERSPFPPYEEIDCSEASRREGGGFCLDRHPSQTYCALKQWIAVHSPHEVDFDFAVQTEAIMRPMFGTVRCEQSKVVS